MSPEDRKISEEDRQQYIAQFRENCPQLCADYVKNFNECFKLIDDYWDKVHYGEDADPRDLEPIYYDPWELLVDDCHTWALDGEEAVRFVHQGESVEAVQSAIDRAIASKESDELTEGIGRIVCTAAMEQAHNFGKFGDFAEEFSNVLMQALVGDENYKKIEQDYVLGLHRL